MPRIVFEEFVSSPWDSTTPLCRVDDTGWVTWIDPYGCGDWKDAPGKLARAALKAAVAKLAHGKQNPVLERQSNRKTSGRVRVMPDGGVFEEDTQLNKWFSASDYNDVSALRNAIAVLTTTLGLILNATDHAIPRMDGAKFVRFVPDLEDPTLRAEERPFAWAVYICHDTCHDVSWQSAPALGQNDTPAHYEERNVIIALHRRLGIFRVIGRGPRSPNGVGRERVGDTMNQRDQAKQLHELADMCRAEDHSLADKTAHIIHTIASNVACGYLETAKSTARGLVHAFKTTKILRGLDPTYAELTAQIVCE